MKVASKTFPGALSSHNRGTLTWGDHGLIAYGANTVVAIFESSTLKNVSTLHAHRCCITKIAWAPSPLPADSPEHGLYLASADTSGLIVFFDVASGKVKQKLAESNKVLNDLELLMMNSTDLMLLSLQQPALFILWNPKTGEQVWKKSFAEPLSSFTLDPFSPHSLVLNGGSFLRFIDDFSATHGPSDGHKLFLSAASGSMLGSNSTGSGSASSIGSLTDKARRALEIPSRSTLTLNDKSASKSALTEEESYLSDLQSVSYHKTRKDTLVLLYQQDILILDLDIKHTIAIISLERSTCHLMDVYMCKSRDAMYCLHENGTVIFRIKKSLPEVEGAARVKGSNSFLYESQASSDGFRITRSQKVYGFSICPVSEVKAAVITSEGKLLIWHLRSSQLVGAKPQVIQPSFNLSDVLRPSTQGQAMLDDEMKCSFTLVGAISSLAQPPFVVRMCPPLTTKNYHLYRPFMAVGCLNGTVQVYDMSDGSLYRDLSVHSTQVRAVEWASLHSFVSHACESLNGTVGRSELTYVNIKSGEMINMRQSKAEEGVVQLIRISHLKQYLAVVFKNKPMELWDLKTLTLLREMSPSFPTITALEWSPSALRKKLAGGDSVNSKHLMKEHFVFTDNTCLLHHYTVEGSIVKDGSTIGAQGVSGSVTSMGWKNEILSLGDLNSNVSFWDLKNKKSVNWAMSKGVVRKIKFAPGKDNNKILILFNEELQIWDKNRYTVVSSLKFPEAIGRVNDADWASSDKVVISVADGYVVVTDTSLCHFMSPLGADTGISAVLTNAQLKHKYEFYSKLIIPEYQLSEGFQLNCHLKQLISDSSTNIADRCRVVAHAMGDRFSLDFWTLAAFYLTGSKQQTDADSIMTGDKSKRLESCYHYFLSSTTFKESERSRILLEKEKYSGNEARLDCARKFILMGELDTAIHLLLLSQADTPTFYSDSLRACLLATSKTSGASQSTLKLVSTSLIAHGNLNEGVELLCLIDKSLDACRYLQTYGHWEEAVWLAKVRLEHEECADIIRRWINEHLTSPSVNDKCTAILAALSIGDVMKVVELLYGLQCFSTAAMFLEACNEHELLDYSQHNSPIIEAVYVQYGRLLAEAGMKEAAVHFMRKAGEQGKERLMELSP